jgi:predicted amidohydrolase YtcJ
MKPQLYLIYICASILASCGIKTEQADLVIHNAVIYAMDGSPRPYQAIAIKGEEIVELGPDRQILNKYRSEQTIDAGKKPIYPGFIDAHCHFLEYGLSLSRVDLFGCKSFEEVIARTEKHAAKHETLWVLGRGWDQNLWEGGSFPTNEALNRIWPDKPVFLRRVDGHAAIANDKALELAGITADTKVLGGMILLRDGKPTGLLIDKAMDLVDAVIPPPDEAAKRKALQAAQRDCFALGLTSVADAGLTKDDILLIREMQAKGNLLMPIYAMISDIGPDVDYFLENGPIRDERLVVCSVKCYADGALGSRGACLLKPYSDAPGHHGMMLEEGQHYRDMAKKLSEAGFQMNTHCIGDSAARFILGVYAEYLKGTNDLRWRIEHAQVMNPEDFGTFAKYSIIPSVQPTHATSDMYWAEERLGAERVRGAYAYEELRKQLGMIALGTDFPIEKVNPMLTFFAAVVRQDLSGFPERGYQTENALIRQDALAGMTLWAAIANREEDRRGSLEPGKKADLIMLDRDIMQVDPSALPDTRVLRTFVHGKEVFTR